MENKDIKDRFRITDMNLKIDENRKQESLYLLQKNIEEKKIGVLYNRKKILLSQIRYMDKSVMIIHLILCVILILTAVVMYIKGAAPDEIVLVSMMLSGVLGIVSIAEVSRIFCSGIAELSESCYFNVKQIVAFHMLLSGIINLTILFFGILFVGFQWKINLLQIGLYILVPFVITEGCCLKVLLTEAGRKNSYLLIMVGIFLVIFYMLLASMPELYRITALTIWGAAFIIGILVLGIQIKVLFKGIERGEILCTN